MSRASPTALNQKGCLVEILGGTEFPFFTTFFFEFHLKMSITFQSWQTSFTGTSEVNHSACSVEMSPRRTVAVRWQLLGGKSTPAGNYWCGLQQQKINGCIFRFLEKFEPRSDIFFNPGDSSPEPPPHRPHRMVPNQHHQLWEPSPRSGRRHTRSSKTSGASLRTTRFSFSLKSY